MTQFSTSSAAFAARADHAECVRLSGTLYQSRLAQTEIVRAAINAHGETDTRARLVSVGGDPGLAVITVHLAGVTIRFTTLKGGQFVTRELTLLPSQERGYDVWLTVDGRTFPHQGKYWAAAWLLLMRAALGE